MGVIININNTYKKSYVNIYLIRVLIICRYSKLNEVVWEMFPPLHGPKSRHLDERFNEFNYWKHQSVDTKVQFDF